MEFFFSLGVAAVALVFLRIENRKRRTLEKQLRALNRQIENRAQEHSDKTDNKTA